MRKKNIHGGGAQTNLNGLRFERETRIENLLDQIEYLTKSLDQDDEYYYGNKLVAKVTSKHAFYKTFIHPLGINEYDILSKRLEPDSVVINFITNTVFILEKKYQQGVGSVDEKLQTCDFKLAVYTRLLASTKFKPKLFYVLNDWFNQPKYRDVFNYIEEKKCRYFFNVIPIEELQLDLKSVSEA